MRLNLDDVRVFVACARAGSVSAGAHAHGVVQSAATRQLQRLEGALGLRLLDRTTRPLRLTAAGTEVLAWAEPALDGLDATLGRLRGGQPALAGTLRVAASSIPGEYLAPALLAAFVAQHPAVEPQLSVGDSAEAIAALRAGEVDVAFAGAPVARPPLRATQVAEDELVLAVPAAHPFAGKSEVPLDDLAGVAFVEREGGSGTVDSLRRLLRARGQALPPHRVALHAGNTQAQLAAVRAGAGLAFVSARAIGPGLAAVRLAGLPLRRHLYVCHDAKRCSPLAHAFLAFVAAHQTM